MARAEVDLDDPAKGGDGAATNSADDLLAQLAGDEVDRMLSEADAAAPEALNVDRAVPDAPAVVITPPATDRPVAKSAARKLANVNANSNATARTQTAPLATSVPAAKPAKVVPADNSVLEATEAALDGLFNELNASLPQVSPVVVKAAEAEPVPAVEPAPPENETPVNAQSIEEVLTRRAQDLIAQATREDDAIVPDSSLSTGEPLSAADALAAEMEADERAHLEALKRMKAGAPAEEPEAVAEAVPAPVEAGPTQIDEDKVDYSKPDKADRVPLLVRVLEWINAPLAGLSDGVRAAIGKVALVTTLNAIAVFAYVVLFRRH